MNGRAARDVRNAKRTKEFVAQAHDQLHKGDVDKCHRFLHAALGLDPDQALPDFRPLLPAKDFDDAFVALCMKHRVSAAYVMAVPAQPGRSRLLSGGQADLCKLVDGAVRAALNGGSRLPGR